MDMMPEALRLFILCEATKWNHLPVAGGLYDQHPRFLEHILTIFQIKSEHDQRKMSEARKKTPKRGR